MWSIKHFDFYVRGKRFRLMTDHKPLLTVFNPRTKQRPSKSLRLEHLAMKVQDYDFDIRYCEGRNNIADSLSRLPKNEAVFDDIIDEQYIWEIARHDIPEAITWSEIEEESKKDQTIQNVRLALLSGVWKENLKRYEICKDELSVMNGVLLRGTRFVPPETLRQRILIAGHEGHPGIVRTKQRLRQRVWWPNMDKSAEDLVRSCVDCQYVSKEQPPEPMVRTILPDGPCQHVAIDIMGPLPWSCSLLVIVDYYSRFFEVARLTACTAEEIITHLREVCARWGYPAHMISDNGSQFRSQEFARFCKETGIRLRHSTPYFPRMNGEVERMNGLIKKVLRISYNQNSMWWDDLQRFLLMHRTTLHTVTGVEPARLMLGRLPRDKIPTVKELENMVNYELADRDRMKKEKGKDQADGRLGAKPIDLKIGDEVIVKRMKKPNKLTSTYNTPICKVIARRGGETTAVSSTGEKVTRNVSHFKKFYRPDAELNQAQSSIRYNSLQNAAVTARGSHQTTQPSHTDSPLVWSGIVNANDVPVDPATRSATSPIFSDFHPQVASTPADFEPRQGEMENSGKRQLDQQAEQPRRYPKRLRRGPLKLRDDDHAE